MCVCQYELGINIEKLKFKVQSYPANILGKHTFLIVDISLVNVENMWTTGKLWLVY